MLVQGSVLEYSSPPNVLWNSANSLDPYVPPKATSPSCGHLTSCLYGTTLLTYSPQVMSQEGSGQSHPNHQEEANEDQAWLHS